MPHAARGEDDITLGRRYFAIVVVNVALALDDDKELFAVGV